MTNPQLNSDQMKASDDFFNFLFSADKEMIISGPGGVGKSFLLAHMIKDVVPKYSEMCKILAIDPKFKEVFITATTNQAVSVLNETLSNINLSMQGALQNGVPLIQIYSAATTIHSLLGLVVRDNYKTGSSDLTKTDKTQILSNTILFVDEAYMIDSQLLKFIRECTIDCKIVYIGDHCQLVPVKHKESPIAKAGLSLTELTIPMRTDCKDLLRNNQRAREVVETGRFTDIITSENVVWLDSDAAEEKIGSLFIEDPENCKVLAYTNKQVSAINQYVTAIRGLDTFLSFNETLVVNSAYKTKTSMFNVAELVKVLGISDVQTYTFATDVPVEIRYVEIESHWDPSKSLVVPVALDSDFIWQLSKFYSRQKDWVSYFRLKETFCDLRPTYASTVHKAQGSSYDHVFVDLDDVSTCTDDSLVARLLYVAFTRARKKLYLIGQPKERFGKVIIGV